MGRCYFKFVLNIRGESTYGNPSQCMASIWLSVPVRCSVTLACELWASMGWLLRKRNAHKHMFGQGINLPLRVFQRRAPDVVNVPSHTVHALGSLWRRADIVHNPKDERFPLQNKIRFTRWCLLSRPQASKKSSLHCHEYICTPRSFPPTQCSALV